MTTLLFICRESARDRSGKPGPGPRRGPGRTWSG
jgi:hypothetical protein